MARMTLDSPVGCLLLEVKDGGLRRLEFERGATAPRGTVIDDDPGHGRDLDVLMQAKTELQQYFYGDLTRFTVPVRLEGPAFQRQVWEALKTIAFGQVLTYAEIARRLGSPNAARAVGNACAGNPVAIVVPCHRVLARTGLGGFGGGLPAKRWLLLHEGYPLPASY